MSEKLNFFLSRIKERLWVKPIAMCILSIVGVFLAKTADYVEFDQLIPDITQDSIEKLLSIISTSMLVIATFAVGSMVSAYASASNTATPRSFSLVIADDISQNALSTFIGPFYFQHCCAHCFKEWLLRQGRQICVIFTNINSLRHSYCYVHTMGGLHRPSGSPRSDQR